jgi:hypothetical protein
MIRLFACLVLLSAALWAQQPGELPTPAAAPQSAPPAQAEPAAQPGMITIPAGTEVPLRLSQALTTKNAKAGDPVYAETAFPITVNDRIVIPAGTFVQGRISEVQRPGRVKGRAQVLFHFTTLIYRSGYTVMLPGAVENMPGADKQEVKDKEGTVQESGNKGEDVKTVGKVAATGAGIGAMAGRSVKGAGIGGAAGAAAGLGWVLLTRGPDITLPAGTSVQMVLQRPLSIKTDKIGSY